jgi:hypothetical protein
MSPIDLRIKYKSETGFSPLYNLVKDTQLNLFSGLNEEFKYCNYRGMYVTHQYCEWLENNYFYSPRERYFKNTSNYAAHYDLYREHIHFSRNYILWLEELKCKTYTDLPAKIKKIFNIM